jgi:hypothetical protein
MKGGMSGKNMQSIWKVNNQITMSDDRFVLCQETDFSMNLRNSCYGLYSLFELQAMFAKVTKEHVILNSKKFFIFWFVLSIFAALGTCLIIHVFPPYLEYWQTLCYFVSSSLINLTFAMWVYINRSLKKSATTLNKCFKVSKCQTRHNIL